MVPLNAVRVAIKVYVKSMVPLYTGRVAIKVYVKSVGICKVNGSTERW